MNESICPSDNQLHEFVSGKMSAELHDSIDSHLDSCDTCQETVFGLDNSSDTLFHQLDRASKSTPTGDATGLREMVARAKSIGSRNRQLVSDDNLPEDSGPEPGAILGNYVVQELIAAGGMGRVFKVRHRVMKREVALKILSPDLVSSPAARGRFQREVEAAAKLNHPNIVRAYDADEAEGRHFLVMEFVPGKNLAELIKGQGPLSIECALDRILQTAQALQYAHDQGIVHRDIKPANLLVDEEGVTRVLDMGLARTPITGNDPQSNELTTSRSLMGTAEYMAPEQAQNPRDADHRADIYSLGCTLFFLLTGRPVFDGDSFMDVVFAHREKSIPSLTSEIDSCPAELDAMFQKMVAKSSEHRFQSMADLISEIEQLVKKCVNGKVTKDRPRKATGLAISCVAALILVAILVIRPFGLGRPIVDTGRQVVKSPDRNSKPQQKPRKNSTSENTNGQNLQQPSQTKTVSIGSSSVLSKVDIKMADIPFGTFLMGATDNEKLARQDERPRHEVQLTRAFQLGKFEVTLAQYQAIMGRSPETPKPSLSSTKPNESDNLPVTRVSWLDAIRFCNELSKRNRVEAYYVIDGNNVSARGGLGFRLPTEAEWEFACRARAETIWHFGDDPTKLDEYAWYAKNSKGNLQPVGQKKSNAFGLHDMHGNAPEWCWDRYDPDYYKNSEPINPAGSTKGQQRIFRGGGVTNSAAQTRSAARSPLGMSYGFLNAVGFRVARDIVVGD